MTAWSPSGRPATTTGFEVVADLAEELPEAQDGGKKYVFKLRKGIKFANGSELTVTDVVASFQRIFKVGGPTAGTLYNGIVGADKCLATPATCTLEGGVVADEAAGTVTINLVAPDGEFLQKIAIPHAAILPAEAPLKDVGTDADPRHRPLHDRQLRSEQPAQDGAQSALQGMEQGGAAGRLSGRDPL